MQIYGLSETGDRPYNEDSIFYETENKKLYALVADGLGGCGKGEVASQTVRNEFIKSKPGSVDEMTHFFTQANDKIMRQQDKSVQMKSTAVALCVQNNLAIYGHIGDSRLYHFYKGKLVHQTMDHSVTQLAVLSGEIKESEMRHHEDRNKLLRALGTGEVIKPVVEEEILKRGKHYFLLCTDGFWEYVTEKEMLYHLPWNGNVEKWLKHLYTVWKKEAKDADNSSAVAVRCVI